MTTNSTYLLDILPGHEGAWFDGLMDFAKAQSNEEVKARPPMLSISPAEGRIGTAVLYVHGSLYSWSYNYVSAILARWDSNENIERIVMDFDSPGGLASGCADCAESIKATQTPILAHVRSMAASAAYWLASATDEIHATNDAILGSVGTVIGHVDYSKALDRVGLKVTFITAGEGKVDGNAYEPLSDAGRAKFQKVVDEHYGAFSSAVAENRGVEKKVVTDDWGAHIYTGREALKNGQADTLIGVQAHRPREVRRAYSRHRKLAPRK